MTAFLRYTNELKSPIFLVVLFCIFGINRAQGESDNSERKGVHWGAMPIWNYASDTGFMAGVLAQRFGYGQEGRQPFESLWTLQLSTATVGARDVGISWERTGDTREDLRFSIEGILSMDPYRRYYGLGSETLYAAELDRAGYYFYQYDVFSLNFAARKKLVGLTDFEFGVRPMLTRSVAISGTSAGKSRFGDDYGDEAREGRYLVLSSSLIADRRDSEFIASKGDYSVASLALSPGGFGNLSTWSRVDLDYHRYDSMFEDRWLFLASQARLSQSSEDAPIEEKARLGSFGTLRGLPMSRYRSRDSMSLRSELRTLWLRARIFDLPFKGGTGIFAELGRVGDSFEGLFSARTHMAWGVTIFGSYFTDDFIGAADLGFSEGHSALYVRLGHAI